MLISALSLPLTIDVFYDIVLTLSQYYVDVIKKSLIAHLQVSLLSPTIILLYILLRQMGNN